MRVRPAAVAGIFYPADRQVLTRHINAYLQGSPCLQREGRCPKVLVVPHAGFKYSASIAASAYNLLQPFGEQIKRVVLLGPAHRVSLDGIALPDSDIFITPLAEVEVDAELVAAVAALPQVIDGLEAHADEHCLEVQLPFLQQLIPEFTLLPLVVGRCSAEQVQQLLERVWGGDETLLVVSSDLSHYLGYAQACRKDRHTSEQLCRLEGLLTGEQACGSYVLNGLMAQLRQRELQIELLDLRNSGDTAGDHQRVVGYGAFVVY
jgi:AmmeMemoRadiSam system protein B